MNDLKSFVGDVPLNGWTCDHLLINAEDIVRKGGDLVPVRTINYQQGITHSALMFCYNNIFKESFLSSLEPFVEDLEDGDTLNGIREISVPVIFFSEQLSLFFFCFFRLFNFFDFFRLRDAVMEPLEIYFVGCLPSDVSGLTDDEKNAFGAYFAREMFGEKETPSRWFYLPNWKWGNALIFTARQNVFFIYFYLFFVSMYIFFIDISGWFGRYTEEKAKNIIRRQKKKKLKLEKKKRLKREKKKRKRAVKKKKKRVLKIVDESEDESDDLSDMKEPPSKRFKKNERF